MKPKIIFLSILLLLTYNSCKNDSKSDTKDIGSAYYTCPMHPSVKSDSPGSCPVCNMSLIKVEKQNTLPSQKKGNFITLDKRQQTLAGIKTDTVGYQNINSASTILGTVMMDEQQASTISSRINGRLDKLYIKSSGEFVRIQSPVYAIYSEQLFADQKEYLNLLEKVKNNSIENKLLNELFSASKNKLLLWGLSERQIQELDKSKLASPLVVFYAQSEGYVSQVLVKEGEYINIGTPILNLTDLNKVWIEAQVYSNEIEKMKGINSFQVFSDTYPNEVFSGRLVFSNPTVENGQKVQLLRLSLDNTENKFIPGMMVYVSPKQNAKSVLSVPKSAVLLEKMKTVWVWVHDNTFEQRMVETGIMNKFWIEIVSGLKEGDIVVTEGIYLINSEFILKGEPNLEHNH